MGITERIAFPYGTGDANLLINSHHFVKIYEHMEDELSRKIYKDRLMFSLTNDFTYIRKLIEKIPAGLKMSKWIKEYGENCYIYGAGVRGERIVRMYPEIKFKGFIDKFKCGICAGYEIFKLEKLSRDTESSVLISNMYGNDEIKDYLVKFGFSEGKILSLIDIDALAREYQYFEERCVGKYKDCDSFVDIGCFDGTDSVRFDKWTSCDNSRIYAFEPDKHNFQGCENNLSGLKNVQLIPKGISDENVISKVKVGLEGSSILFDEKKTQGEDIQEVDLVTLDQELMGSRIGYIKIDIEGNELNALRGAKNIIETQKPLIAISIYHKREDVWQIPDLLLEYNENYRFCLGHYSGGIMDTVLYALPLG